MHSCKENSLSYEVQTRDVEIKQVLKSSHLDTVKTGDRKYYLEIRKR